MTTKYLETFQPPIQWVPVTLSLGVKQPEREADYSTSFRAENKISGAILSFPIRFVAVVINQSSRGTTSFFTLFFFSLFGLFQFSINVGN
jgi:hypothetical protein